MDKVRAAVAAERRDMAEVLGALREEQWDAPTLCAGWRVREVVAHTTMPFRMSLPRSMVELAKARGDWNRMADRCARRDAAAMTSAELLRCLTDNIEHPWAPPGGGPKAALSHEVIHGLDVTVGLGLARAVPADRMAIVLDGMQPKNIKFFGTDLEGVELRATDLDWSYGSGKPVEGLAQDLLLAICGRRLPADRLTGAEAGRFTGP